MALASLILSLFFACAAGMPYMYLEARQNNNTVLMKRLGGMPSPDLSKFFKISFLRPKPIPTDCEAGIINVLQNRGGLPGWVKEVCTDPNRELMVTTERSRIFKVQYTYCGKRIPVIVKEIRWGKGAVDKEADRLSHMGYSLGRGYNKRTETHYLVMRYLGISHWSSSELPEGLKNRVEQLVKEARQRYENEYGFKRQPPDSGKDYAFLWEDEIKDYVGHAPGNWRKAEETSKSTVLPVANVRYEEW